MAFDDDDTPAAAPGVVAATGGDAPEELPTVEEALEEETQDFLQFASMFKKKNVSAQTIRKGEKDFESHGTNAQANALERSRQAMEDVLSFTRIYKPTNWIRGWYFPDHFSHWTEEEDDIIDDRVPGDGAGIEKKRKLNARDRVVIVEGDLGVVSKTHGRVVTGQAKDQVAKDKTWLLPEEALFLVERGSLDLWWPMRGLDVIFPPAKQVPESLNQPPKPTDSEDDKDDEYDLGIPLSLQAAYSLLTGNDGERGKITIQKFQVYSNLKRLGYKVLRASSGGTTPDPVKPQPTSVWSWLFSLVPPRQPHQKPFGPLVQPGLYRSYKSVYKQLELIPRHKPTPVSPLLGRHKIPFRFTSTFGNPARPFPKRNHQHPTFTCPS